MTRTAHCCCGALRVQVFADPNAVGVCHCGECQRRTGSVFGAWLRFYNEERPHQSLGYRTPRQIYEEGLWICGRSALPTGSASPASRASSEGGEMLAFAHIPTGTTANRGFDR